MSHALERIMYLLILLMIVGAGFAFADPTGATIIGNTTESPSAATAGVQTTAGGSFTTMVLNATTQTMKWKAYVGNVSGSFTLQDASNFKIYDWTYTTISGEVYASRNNTVDWSLIRCANNTTLINEQTSLNITTTKDDSINRTFNNTIHRSFYVGTRLITNSTCRAIATYVNNTRQAATESATFQEILLDDTQRMVYVTLLENRVQGYNNQNFDFQMIVAESETAATPSPYYFWVELS